MEKVKILTFSIQPKIKHYLRFFLKATGDKTSDRFVVQGREAPDPSSYSSSYGGSKLMIFKAVKESLSGFKMGRKWSRHESLSSTFLGETLFFPRSISSSWNIEEDRTIFWASVSLKISFQKIKIILIDEVEDFDIWPLCLAERFRASFPSILGGLWAHFVSLVSCVFNQGDIQMTWPPWKKQHSSKGKELYP